MAERHAPASRAAPPAQARTRSGFSGTGVRRNLFQSQLTRRPTPGAPAPGESFRLDPEAQSETSDIVVRDKNGEVDLGDPPTPPVDEPDEIPPDARRDNEKERQRLSEAVKQHQIDQNSMPSQPEELLEAVRASLRAKVAALSEDNWMFEEEEPPRLG